MFATFGTAWAKGISIALRLFKLRLKAFGTFLLGHFSIHAPHPVHLVSST